MKLWEEYGREHWTLITDDPGLQKIKWFSWSLFVSTSTCSLSNTKYKSKYSVHQVSYFITRGSGAKQLETSLALSLHSEQIISIAGTVTYNRIPFQILRCDSYDSFECSFKQHPELLMNRGYGIGWSSDMAYRA